MSETPSTGPNTPVTTDFAPADYTDGRTALEWETKYPPEARKKICAEAIYLGIMFVAFLVATFAILKYWDRHPHPAAGNPDTLWLGYLSVWVGGTMGGLMFNIKWLYHTVAKRIWHEDRLLWRIFQPHVSGAVALFTLLLIASGLVQVFNADLINHPVTVLGFGFLTGYFSDKALAKLTETADAIFGPTKGR